MAGLPKEAIRQQQEKFSNRLKIMGRLAGAGRLIECTMKIADQLLRGLEEAETLDKLQERLRVSPNEVQAAREALFPPGEERDRLQLVVGLANKLAHFDYYAAKNKVDQYKIRFGIESDLKDERLKGWHVQADGHMIDEEGPIDSVTMWFTHSKDNLIVEQFDYIEHNGYVTAIDEIVEDAWQRILGRVPGIATRTEKLSMLRAFTRGEILRTKQNPS